MGCDCRFHLSHFTVTRLHVFWVAVGFFICRASPSLECYRRFARLTAFRLPAEMLRMIARHMTRHDLPVAVLPPHCQLARMTAAGERRGLVWNIWEVSVRFWSGSSGMVK